MQYIVGWIINFTGIWCASAHDGAEWTKRMEILDMAVPWSECTPANLERARVYLEQVYSAQSPDSWVANKTAFVLGCDAHRRGLRQQAKQWFKRSKFPDALNALGCYAFSEQKYDAAFQYWQQGAMNQEIEDVEESSSVFSKINYVIMLYGKRRIDREYASSLLANLLQRRSFLRDYMDADWCFEQLFPTPDAVFDYAGSLKRLIKDGDERAKFMELFFAHHMILSSDEKKDWDDDLKVCALRQKNPFARRWLAELFWRYSWRDVDYMLCASFLHPDEYVGAMYQNVKWRKQGVRACLMIPFVTSRVWHLRIK